MSKHIPFLSTILLFNSISGYTANYANPTIPVSNSVESDEQFDLQGFIPERIHYFWFGNDLNASGNFNFRPVYFTKIKDRDYCVFSNSLNSADFLISWGQDGKTKILTPSDWFGMNWNPHGYLDAFNTDKMYEYTLYDFNLKNEDTFTGISGHIFYPGNSVDFRLNDRLYVVKTRTINLGNYKRRVQLIGDLDNRQVPSFDNYCSRMLPKVIVEGLGDIGENSLCGILLEFDILTTIRESENYIPYCEGWNIRYGDEIRYITRDEIGLRPFDQLLCDDSVWEYYSEDEHLSAVHHIGVTGTENIDGKDYKTLKTIKSTVLDKSTGDITVYSESDLAGCNKWLMREDFGRVYTLLDDGSEIMVYDFAFQNDERATIGGNDYVVSGVDCDIQIYSNYSYGYQKIKSYKIQSEANLTTCTEFIGCHGMNSGFVPFPSFFQPQYIKGMVITPETPASDCTLTRYMKRNNEEKYVSTAYTELAEPLLLEAAGMENVPRKEISSAPDACFDITGRSTDLESAKGITIIHNQDNVRKIMK